MLAGMGRRRDEFGKINGRHSFLLRIYRIIYLLRLMVVRKLNLAWPLVGPDETNPELIVNAYRPLAISIGGQAVKPVSRRRPQVIDALSRVKLREPTADRLGEVGGKSFGRPTFEDPPRGARFPALNQPNEP